MQIEAPPQAHTNAADQAYLDVVARVLEHGVRKENRTGVDTISSFAEFYSVDLANGYPLLTTKKVFFGSMLQEVLWYLTGADTERPVLNLGLTFLGILWIGALASFAALMIRAEDGVGLLLATIIITAASDTFAYLGGRAYGTKPFHSASPNKTWEGTITGFVGALLAGVAIGVTNLIGVFDGQFMSVIVLAAIVGLLAPIGDLAESMVKRDLGVKDMGTLLPGHGGILDRVDGLLFALPGAYYVAIVYSLI